MIRKLKNWFYNRFLPEYCRRKLLEDLDVMKQKQDDLQRENERLRAYIEGLAVGIRAQRRIVINNHTGKGG